MALLLLLLPAGGCAAARLSWILIKCGAGTGKKGGKGGKCAGANGTADGPEGPVNKEKAEEKPFEGRGNALGRKGGKGLENGRMEIRKGELWPKP
jgi:hypothetical protein